MTAFNPGKLKKPQGSSPTPTMALGVTPTPKGGKDAPGDSLWVDSSV